MCVISMSLLQIYFLYPTIFNPLAADNFKKYKKKHTPYNNAIL